jgi:hypothetical protein
VLPETVPVTQVTSEPAVHEQPEPAVTLTVKLPLPPAAAMEAALDDSAYVHAALAPACVTVNVCPPAVMWPVRELVVVLAATVYVTEPLLRPELEVVIQLTSLLAVHVHPEPAVTLKLPLPPAAATDAELDDSEYEQEPATVKDTLPKVVVVLSTM